MTTTTKPGLIEAAETVAKRTQRWAENQNVVLVPVEELEALRAALAADGERREAVLASLDRLSRDMDAALARYREVS